MFRPNRGARHFAMIGRDLHARETYAEPVNIRIGIVKLASGSDKTTVRADSSASRGSAEEVVIDGKILVLPTVRLKRDDKVEIDGASYRVARSHPRYTVSGLLDHHEIDLEALVE